MSETVDSGHNNKSNFSHTYNLLSQYLKEKGSLGDLTLGMAANSSKQIPKKQGESAAGQMTIFYAGQVIVLDDFPADKAMDIILLAAAAQHPPSDLIPKPTHLKELALLRLKPPVVSDLPIARKASLARFLEKRKERLTARAPYHETSTSASTSSKQAWLGGLAGESVGQFQAQS